MTIRLEADGDLAFLLVDRPDKHNAMTTAMWEAIPPLLAPLCEAGAVRAVVLAAARPGPFSAGADIAEFAANAGDPASRQRNQQAIANAMAALANLSVPVIAAIEGACMGGGCGLALAADYRMASPDARFAITPARLGLVYPLGDTARLVQCVGPSAARRLLFTAETIGAEEALRLGLVDELHLDARAAAVAMARRIAALSPHSMRGLKAMVARVLAGRTDEDEASRALFMDAFSGPDFAEGARAFLERRPPRF